MTRQITMKDVIGQMSSAHKFSLALASAGF